MKEFVNPTKRIDYTHQEKVLITERRKKSFYLYLIKQKKLTENTL